MKRLIFLLLFLTPLVASERTVIKGEVGYFRPSQRVVREVYGTGWLNLALSGEFRPASSIQNDPLALFASINYLSATGRSEGMGEGSSIYVVPLTFGAKWYERISESFSAFVGLAPRCYLVEIKNSSSFVKKDNFLHGFGALALAGIRYKPSCNFVVDLTVGYSSTSLDPSDQGRDVEPYTVHLGGLEISGGVGWSF